MSQVSGLVHGWSHAEDDLLLQFLHVSLPGGRFDGPREFSNWPMIAENMTRTAPRLGLTGSYSRDVCAMRYSRYVLTRMTLSAAQNRPGRARTSQDTSVTNSSCNNVLQWITDLHLAEADPPQPGDTALGDLVTWNGLVDWATKVVEYPKLIFSEEGMLLQLDTNPEVPAAEENPWGIRAQYELDYFNEIFDWAKNIVRQDELDEAYLRSG